MYLIGIYLLIGVLAILSLFKLKNHKIEIIFFALFLIFICSRFPLGTDIDAYNLYFSQTPLSIIDALKGTPYPDNIGYNVFMCIAKNIYDSFNFYMIFFNVIMAAILGYITYKYSKNYYISAMILLGSGMVQIYFGGSLRQMIITAIFLFAYFEFLAKNKYILYYISILIAITFHWVALILLLVPIFKIYYEKVTNKWLKYALPIGVCIGCYLFISYIMPSFAYLIPGRFSTYFLANSFSLMGLCSRIVVLFVVLLAYYLTDKSALDNWDKFSIYMCFLSFLIYVVFVRSSDFSRVADLFSIIEIVLLPKLIMNIKPNVYKQLFMTLIVLGVNFIFLVTDIKYIASRSLKNRDITNFPIVWVWEDVDFDELFQGF